ncbi:MAG: DUF4406 domain-containing protein [Candidatus Sumerlaeaceae bacterium]
MSYDCIYIAGPMRGIPGMNHTAFHEAEERLTALGYVVINPARIEDEFSGVDWAGCLRRDIALIVTRCQTLAVLPGWEHSRGASLEVHIARALGMKVIELDNVPAAPGLTGDRRP